MHQYIVEIDNPSGTAFFHEGDRDVFRTSETEATLFTSYAEAVRHIAEVLHDGTGGLDEPVQIHIVPVPELAPEGAADDEWSIEDILRNAG